MDEWCCGDIWSGILSIHQSDDDEIGKKKYKFTLSLENGVSRSLVCVRVLPYVCYKIKQIAYSAAIAFGR